MKMHFKIIDISYTSSLSSKSICSSYFLHLAWQYGQCQYRRTIKEMMNSPFGMTIEATIEYKVSSKLYLKKWNIDINMKFVVLWNEIEGTTTSLCFIEEKLLRFHYDPWIEFAVITWKVFPFSIHLFVFLCKRWTWNIWRVTTS